MLKLSFQRQILAGFIFSLLLVFGVFYFSYTDINNLQKKASIIDHSESVVKSANTVQLLLLNGETGEMGYVATGKDTFLEPYNSSVFRVSAILTELQVLAADNPIQVRNVDSLSHFARIKISDLNDVVYVSRLYGLDSARKELAGATGKYDMDKVRLYVKRIVNEENNQLKIKKVSSDNASNVTTDAIIISAIIIVCVVLLLFYYIQTSFLKLQKSEENFRQTNIELTKVSAEDKAKNWLLTGTSLLNEKIQGQQSETELAGNILTEICGYTGAIRGAFYLYSEETGTLGLSSSYAVDNPDLLNRIIKFDETILGQAANDKKTAIVRGELNSIPNRTSSSRQNPTESFIVPFFFDKKLAGIMEVAFYSEPDRSKKQYILMVADAVGIAINTARARTIMHDLLTRVQQQAEELEAQHEEMRHTNQELLSKTKMLQASQEELKSRQDELKHTNAELEEKAELLSQKNRAIEEARQAIATKVQELETTSKYKSEFLANMSHELRTPLNSIMVLAQVLRDNKPANLTADQIKYASVILNAGNDLLTLINDILDLSKVESGKLVIQNETVKLREILFDMEMLFAEIAAKKKIRYTLSIDQMLPAELYTDKLRVEQVLKNLLSNAFKFTPDNGLVAVNVVNDSRNQTIRFCIKDTGIGIPHDKQKAIFEVFQQADGSTSRKYGGTGLGLPISRDLTALLGGEISLTSEPGKGSEFVMTLPLKTNPLAAGGEKDAPLPETLEPVPAVVPGKETVKKIRTEPLVIIVEDDENFAGILDGYARDHGCRSLILNDGTTAVEAIKENQPDAVVLDIKLPGKNGWQILNELKRSEETLHIPVHLMSAGEAANNRIVNEGAISFIKKPASTNDLDKLFTDMSVRSGTTFKQVLLIEANTTQSRAVYELMKDRGISVDQAFDGESAYRMLHRNEYQCIILDFDLPDISGLDLLDRIKENERFKNVPVIINTAMGLDKTSLKRLMHYANAMVVKSSKSANKLTDEVTLFLNRINETSELKRRVTSSAKDALDKKARNAIKGKKILIVDDDMRNIFALSGALKNHGMHIEVANDGLEAVNKLEQIPGIDIVLMDIMMPKMDGYEATRHIRSRDKWIKLPVIALTAKAMIDDREKCIVAGANDYITKPVDVDKLVSLMKLWMED
ncbi:MAG TPA: response regulator [Mucilaginibacter sp.]|jgi:signal transduction histidine kinase/DNA-binding response OmpR family regulator/CHASE3 domain sensor protein|nr:response regulator [Mucilaginibacter sp.]